MKKASWILLGIMASAIGLYPITYFVIDRKFGLLSSKTADLLSDFVWNTGFYGHILLGGFALLIGWLQFNKRFRNKNLKLHRRIGKAYILAVLISGFCSLYIALYATGGIVPQVGFFSLGVVWLTTTYLAYQAIKNGKIERHQKFMIYSYAACFAAVTLRIWLPILSNIFGQFLPAYRIVAWLCWVPNMIVAYFIVRKTYNVS
ncbi:MAG: DUF2306 domain-containing protein [Gilvibacter sp.]